MVKEENTKKDVKSKEDLQKRLESKVLGLLEEPEGKPVKKEGPKTPGPVEKKEEPKKPGESKAAGKEKPPASEKTPDEDMKEEPKTEKPPEAEKAPEKPIPGTSEASPEKPEESLESLLKEREEIEALLSSIEDSYRDATLPDKTYHEVKNKNEKKLEEINKKIEKLQKTATPEELKKIRESSAAAEKPAPETKEAAPPEPSVDKPPEAKPEPRASEKPPGPGIATEDKKRIDPVIKLLEEKIEDKLRNVIETANVEITDKRMKKLEGRLDVVERAAKDMKGKTDTATQTIGGYDKQFTLMKTEVEKVKALVDAVKEAKNIMDEKLQRTTETFAEIRSIVYQREAKSKEEEVLIDKLKDTISQVDTARILKEFTTRDEQLKDVNTRLERMERSEKMLSDSISKIKGLMTDIGSLENIVKASKHVGEKLEKIQEIEERMKASSSKLDSVYVDMKKKLDEFTEYKVKQDKLSGMVDDIVKNVEDFTRRLSDYATKGDITQIKDEMKIVRESVKKAQAVQVPPEVAGLNEEKEQIETLLATLEENYKNKEIPEAEYQKAKESNMLKLAQIQKKIASASSGKRAAGTGNEPSGGGSGDKHARVMMLAKLRESYENGEISKAAYEKSRRFLLKKR